MKASTQPLSTTQPSSKGPAVRVLLVEDEQAHAELARRAFETHGKRFQVFIASSIKEAIGLLAQSDPHLVLSDWRLPDGLGTDLLPLDQARIPIVVMTSQGDEQVAVEVMKAGALDYVVKSPEAFNDLPLVAERALREWQALRDQERSRRRLQAQYEFMTILARGGNMDEAFPPALAHAARHIEAMGLELWMLEPPDHMALRFSWDAGESLAAPGELSLGLGSGWLGDLFEAGCETIVQSVPNDELVERGLGEDKSNLSACVEPVMVSGEARGLLIFFGQNVNWRENTEVCQFARAVSAQLAGFLQRQKLQDEFVERERLAALGTAAAMFAHEVGNPLNNMFLHAQMLNSRLGKLGAPESAQRGIRSVLDEMRRLNQLLQEFRSLSRKQPLRVQDVDISKLISQVLDIHVRQSAAVEISLEVDLPAALPSLRADPDKLFQVFLNLCKNALEAMAEGGTLSVRARSQGKLLSISLRDTGPGLPEGLDVFEPFKTTKAEGTGLGLPVVRQIVYAHGGNVTAHNAPDAGAEFIVTLPLESL